MQIEITRREDSSHRALQQHGRRPLTDSVDPAGRHGSRRRLARAGRRNALRLDAMQPLAHEAG